MELCVAPGTFLQATWNCTADTGTRPLMSEETWSNIVLRLTPDVYTTGGSSIIGRRLTMGYSSIRLQTQ